MSKLRKPSSCWTYLSRGLRIEGIVQFIKPDLKPCGSTPSSSFDDPYIIAGQGTTGLEIALEARKLGIQLDGLITCIGGGGLCAGISLAMNHLSRRTKIYGAEPEFYNDHEHGLPH